MSPTATELVAILARLPHRYPRLLVDRITEHVHGQSARAIKNVTVNEPFFQGHFPDYPVMPGVLVIEALVQLSALLAHDHGLCLDLSGISGARFKRQISPGDQLLLEAVMDPMAGGAGTFSVKVTVDGELAAEAQLLAVFTPLADSADPAAR
ncbi:MAG TPA: 3-hydroxyacyl-ACP dehydratase FabZ [Casimicrobiaceae bacterium]|nr:3-hydroxyacyl-ACP dehydratase FabZ [Casimicrobiaceae bacterium]